MSLTVHIQRNLLDAETIEVHEDVTDLGALLKAHLGSSAPKNLRVFHEYVDKEHDVTPSSPEAAEALGKLQGLLYIIVYPSDPGTIFAGVFLLLAVSAVRGAMSLLAPDRQDNTRQIRPGSPNNTLGDRQNIARLGQRIPDIYGSVNSTPDLIAVPYITYDNHRQVEIALLCVGRGQFEVDRVREGETRAQDISGMSVRVYPPGQIPGGGTPQSPLIGPDIDDPVFTVIPVEGVNGDVLVPYNARAVLGFVPETRGSLFKKPSMSFRYLGAGVGEIDCELDHDPAEVTNKISLNDEVELYFPTTSVSTAPISVVAGIGTAPDLSAGNSTVALLVTNVDDSIPGIVRITVAINASQQAQWALISTYNPGPNFIYNRGAVLVPITGYWLGPFFCDDPGPHPNGQKIYCNFVADRGLFADDGKNQAALYIHLQVAVYAADASGNTIGAPEYFNVTLGGSTADRTTRAITFIIDSTTTRVNVGGTPVGVGMTNQGRFVIYARRITPTYWRQDADTDTLQIIQTPLGITYVPTTGLIEDTVRWTHCYSMSRPPNISFGSLTLVHVRTVAPRDARPKTTRKLNMLVTRQHGTWNGTTFGGAATSTEDATDILMAILKDSFLGNVPDAQIDFNSIADTFTAIDAHFFDLASVRFSATFDEDNLSLEDLIASVAESCFAVAYREGNVLKLKPDIDSDASVVLFNHRNINPGSMQRTFSFGTEEDYEGVSVDYFDDTDDRIKTYFVPKEESSASIGASL